MNEIAIVISAIVAVIIAICQALKYAGFPSRFIPLVSIALGIAGALYFGKSDLLTVLAGIVTGLTASGLFSAFKATILNK